MDIYLYSGFPHLFSLLVQGNRTNYNHFKGTEEAVPYSHETEEIALNSEMDNSVSSSFNPSSFQMRSQATDATSLSSAQASEFEDAESGALSIFVTTVCQ